MSPFLFLHICQNLIWAVSYESKEGVSTQTREAFGTTSDRHRRVDGDVCVIFVHPGAGPRSPEEYGSNLTVDAAIECDATIADHHKRSGAVGAVQQVRNPIHLVRLALKNFQKSNFFNHVPPTLLVDTGASRLASRNSLPKCKKLLGKDDAQTSRSGLHRNIGVQ